jgi:serine/threonine protein kinase
MVHLDVKPSNLYVSLSGHVKLGDFGNARSAESFPLDSIAQGLEPLVDLIHGDRKYVAPEVLGIEPKTVEEAGWYAADIFSLGLSLYELASSEPLPAQGEGYARLRRGDVPRPGAISHALAALIASMLEPDPRQRPTAGAD